MPDALYQLAEQLLDLLKQRQKTITTAESCTGGWVAKCLTDVPGSSSVFDRGFVTYSNESKQEMLGVPSETLSHYGAVSEETAIAMVKGALNNSQADMAVAITGIAGPGGGNPDKPVGTVCFAWAFQNNHTQTETLCFKGDRDAVRRQSVQHALQVAIKGLSQNNLRF
ncbi:MAG TPA: nicotinamide-nucleotide amidase [Chromatiales bacterium]|nr:nicotinamide-nucleotide amidase [Thiotrichales bacterium]HIP68015.1 nicotinamide-nucleotide amidase [Chromatiales bacterium]